MRPPLGTTNRRPAMYRTTPHNEIADAIAGLSAEAKIIALTNALVESGVTLHRDADPGDGLPCVFATLPDGSTATVMHLPTHGR